MNKKHCDLIKERIQNKNIQNYDFLDPREPLMVLQHRQSQSQAQSQSQPETSLIQSTIIVPSSNSSTTASSSISLSTTTSTTTHTEKEKRDQIGNKYKRDDVTVISKKVPVIGRPRHVSTRVAPKTKAKKAPMKHKSALPTNMTGKSTTAQSSPAPTHASVDIDISVQVEQSPALTSKESVTESVSSPQTKKSMFCFLLFFHFSISLCSIHSAMF